MRTDCVVGGVAAEMEPPLPGASKLSGLAVARVPSAMLSLSTLLPSSAGSVQASHSCASCEVSRPASAPASSSPSAAVA